MASITKNLKDLMKAALDLWGMEHNMTVDEFWTMIGPMLVWQGGTIDKQYTYGITKEQFIEALGRLDQ